MILTGRAIHSAVLDGSITIEPFDPDLLNPNSYNYRLGPTLKVIDEPVVDARDGSAGVREVAIPGGGLILQPCRLYLGSTRERIGSVDFVPSLIGRSSLGRLGVFLEVSADLGQLGAVHKWTLEIVVTQPTRLYSGMRVGQVSFWEPHGVKPHYSGYCGRYSEPTPSNPQALRFGS